ncbi:MAG: 50S ribosomal protein L25 [Candidatus Hydrogenedentales bacterium]|jgi:large subunit ribosomal protein L25
MELQKLAIDLREEADGKGANHRLRKAGRIPIVLYGGDKEAVSAQVNEKEFVHLIRGRGGEHAIVQLECSGQPDLNSPAMLKDVQHHAIRGNVLHADFMRIRLDERIRVMVPLVLTGQPKGVVVEGGVLDPQLRDLEVECLALEVPDEITVDVSDLDIGDVIHVESIVIPANVTLITEADRAVATVLAPRVVEEEEVEPEDGEVAEGEEAEDEADDESSKEEETKN